MFPDLQVALIEILLSAVLLTPFGQPQQQVILDVLQLDRRDATLDHSLPEAVDMGLQQRHWSNEQIITSANQINEEKQMVSYETVDSLIVCYRVSWPKLNHNLFG